MRETGGCDDRGMPGAGLRVSQCHAHCPKLTRTAHEGFVRDLRLYVYSNEGGELMDGRKAAGLLLLAHAAYLAAAEPNDEPTPGFLRDRGSGVQTSLFGTYVREGELLIYPFYEYETNDAEEYHPSELGFGAIKGFSWGTLSARYSVAYEDGNLQGGEFALEYLKRLSPRWRMVVALEGEGEDLSLITEAQFFVTPRVFLKLNSGFGLSSKVPGFAPEVGLMMSVAAPRRR